MCSVFLPGFISHLLCIPPGEALHAMTCPCSLHTVWFNNGQKNNNKKIDLRRSRQTGKSKNHIALRLVRFLFWTVNVCKYNKLCSIYRQQRHNGIITRQNIATPFIIIHLGIRLFQIIKCFTIFIFCTFKMTAWKEVCSQSQEMKEQKALTRMNTGDEKYQAFINHTSMDTAWNNHYHINRTGSEWNMKSSRGWNRRRWGRKKEMRKKEYAIK